MKIKTFSIFLSLLLISCSLKKSSDFEQMLEGFPNCKFKDLYVDYNTHVPQHQYFKDRGLMPTKVENEAAFFDVNETFRDIKVDEIVIDAGYGIVSIRLDAPVDVVEKKMRNFLKYGYNNPPPPAGGEVTLITPSLTSNRIDSKRAKGVEVHFF